ncbi:MAG: ribosomal RNA small subunit methyltransferase A [Bradymonadaceae bacterium]|nr:ribosomal RNA small subunit methyltransferase A [Lujinxingiaceae bacterium]
MSSQSPYETPSQLLRGFEHRAKKRFGQHFLTDPRILDAISTLAGVGAGDRVLEIGPGCGTLTLSLLQHGASVQAVELDRDAIAFVREALEPYWPLTIVEGDVLRKDLSVLLAGEADDGSGGPWKVVANLPYNVATEIFFRLVEQRERIAVMVLMFQKEVARRLVARVGDDGYGALSLMCRLHCDAEIVMNLPPGAFVPPPKVHSAVVRMVPLVKTRIEDEVQRRRFIKVVKGAFSTRRKTLPNALRTIGLDKDEVAAALEAMGLKTSARAEELGFEQFVALSERVTLPV